MLFVRSFGRHVPSTVFHSISEGQAIIVLMPTAVELMLLSTLLTVPGARGESKSVSLQGKHQKYSVL